MTRRRKLGRRELFADNQMMVEDIAILAWLHAEQRHIAYDRAAELASANLTIEALERSEAKWRDLAQAAVASDVTAPARGIEIEGHGRWSVAALAVALDEFDQSRVVIRKVATARDTVRRLVDDAHSAGICHPIYEQALRIVDSLLSDAASPNRRTHP